MYKLLQLVDCLVARLERSLVLQKYLRNEFGVLLCEETINKFGDFKFKQVINLQYFQLGVFN